MNLATILNTHEALLEHHALRKEVMQVLSQSRADTYEGELINIAIEVFRLNPEEKVRGIKILRTVYKLSIRDAKLLWELGQTLGQP